jgi:hypothetical protein
MLYVSNVTNANRDRFDFTNMRAKPLNQRTNRRHDDCRRSFRLVETPQDPRTPAHRVDRWTHSFERKGFPSREEFDLISAKERGEVVDQSLGFCGRGHCDHDWPAFGPVDQRRNRDGSGWFRDDDGAFTAPQDRDERGLISHHRNQIGQSHRTSGHADMPGTNRAGGE